MSTRVRVLALALVLVLSTVAGVAGGAPAAAVTGSEDGEQTALVGTAGVVAQTSTPDGSLDSGSSFWQGWRLRFDATGVVAASGGDRSFEIWRVTEDGQLNQRIETVTVDGSGTHVVPTDGLHGRYVLRYGDQPVYVHEGRAYLTSPPDGSEVTVGTSAFRVQRQTLALGWGDPTVYPGQAVTLTVESNRPSSVVAVSGSDLTYEDLAATFPDSAYADDHDARADEDVLLIEVSGQTDLLLNTESFTTGDQSLDFDVEDTTASASTDVTVLTPGSNGRFLSIERREQVGDVIEADVACGSCFVVVGGPDQGLLDVVEVADSNGDGNVTLRINTRYAGMVPSAPGYPSGVKAYSSPVDSVERYSAGATLESVSSALIASTSTLSNLRSDVGLASQGRTRPLTPGRVDLTVTSSDFVIEQRKWGDRPPLGGDIVVRDESDVETVTLEPRTLDGVEPLAATGDHGFEATASNLRDAAAPRDQMAMGDRLVFRIHVSGVFGHLEARGTSLEAVIDNEEEGIDLTLERIPDGGARTAERIRLDRTNAELVPDPTEDQLYLVIGTGGTSSARLDAGTYRATLSLEGVDAKYDEYSTFEGYEGYPYLDPGDSDEVSGTVTIAEPVVSIAEPAAGTSPHLTAEGVLQVTGTTSIASGTTVSVRANATEYAWETRATTAVRDDGTWDVELGLAEAPGDEFTVAVERGSERLASETYTVLPAPPEATSGENASSDGGGSDGGGSNDVAAGDGEEAASGTTIAGIPIPDLGGLVVPVGGGIGGLAVVWGAWRFVIRRLLL